MSNEAKEDTQFEGEYIAARLSGYLQKIASVLSERLRQMDKRAREANKRADAAKAENVRLREAIHDLLTRPTDPSARQRVRITISEAQP